MADFKKKKALIIEDDKFLNKVLANKFRKEGFEVSQAVNGDEGIRRVIDERPDIVLLDIMLPGKDGFEVLTEIRANKHVKDTPVIIISNLGQGADIARAKDLGVEMYVLKTDMNLSDVVEHAKEEITKKGLKK